VTFKDLKKRVSLEVAQQQSKLFERLRNKPFWIWNTDEHRQEDIITKGDCCFNHVIGLPTKEGIERAIFDYEKILYDALLVNNIIRFSIYKFQHQIIATITSIQIY
jgi:hypothetical protein